MSYYGPTTTREVGTVRRDPLWLVLARLAARTFRRLSRQFRQFWNRLSAPVFGRSGVERFAGRAASLVMALLLVGVAARGEVAFAAAGPSGAKSNTSFALASQSLDASTKPSTDPKTSTSPSNTGLSNTGLSNTGLSNTGLSNTGLSKAGTSKTGLSNTGLSNTGPSKPKPRTTDASTRRLLATKLLTTKRFGGRVQRDAFGHWIVDGTLIGLATVNIPGGQDAVFDTTVPAGLTPIELRGRYVVPPSSAQSSLEIGISGGTPQLVDSTKGREFSALTKLSASGSGTDYVEFTARTKVDAACPDYLPTQLDQLQLVVDGTGEEPAMIADFFPPFLDRMVVRVDATMSKSKEIDEKVAQAVLRLTTFAAQRWPAARVIVSDKAIAMTPYDRQVSLRVKSKSSIALETEGDVTTLVLSGPKSQFTNLAEFLSSPALETAFVSSLITTGQTPSSLVLSHIQTIGDLRGRALVGKGFGSVDQVITVTQSQLGGQTDSIAVKVTGVAQVAGAGRLVVQLRANDQVLATKRVLNDEPFALKGTISRSALTRDNVIVVRASELSSGTVTAEKLAASPGVLAANAASGAIVCGLGRPEVTLQLDPGSQFVAKMGRGLPAGFDRFPQAFVNGFDVRFASLGLGELQAGSDVVQLLQSLSAPRLSPKVFGPNRSHTPTRPMIYVGPPTKELTQLDAPIVPETRPSNNAEPISVLQGFAATGDDHLVLVTNGPASDLASTLAAVQADPRGWRSLHGDVVVRQNGRVKNVRVRTSVGNGEEKRKVVLHSRIGYSVRIGFGIGTSVALFGALLAKLFGRKHS